MNQKIPKYNIVSPVYYKMDLNQQKLSKREWDTTEIPVTPDEKEILKMIVSGYHDVNIIYNKNLSMINFLKL